MKKRMLITLILVGMVLIGCQKEKEVNNQEVEFQKIETKNNNLSNKEIRLGNEEELIKKDNGWEELVISNDYIKKTGKNSEWI